MQEINTDNEKELDLGVFLNVFSRLLRKSLSIFRRRIVWFLLVFVLGLALSAWKYTRDQAFFSDMYIQSDYEGKLILENEIKQYNALIKEGNIRELTNLLNVSPQVADALKEFEITDVRENASGLFLTVRLFSTKADVFNELKGRVFTSLSITDDYKAKRSKVLERYLLEQKDILASLKQLDSIRANFLNNNDKFSPYNSLYQRPLSMTTGYVELDIFNTHLRLKRDLKNLQNAIDGKSTVFLVVSPFNGVAVTTKPLGSYIKFLALAIGVTFLVFLSAEIVKYLNKADIK